MVSEILVPGDIGGLWWWGHLVELSTSLGPFHRGWTRTSAVYNVQRPIPSDPHLLGRLYLRYHSLPKQYHQLREPMGAFQNFRTNCSRMDEV